MMKRVWIVGFAVLSGVFTACSDSKDVAGSSMETENSIAVNVQLADGSPAARMKVLVRPETFLSGVDSNEIDNYVTDEDGNVTLNLSSGDYVIEARGASDKAAAKLTYNELDTNNVEISLDLKKPGTVKGQVALPVGVKSVSVGILGLDYKVETDSLGNFEFESLPAGDFDVVAFIYTDSAYTNEFGLDEHTKRMMTFGRASAEIKSGKEDKVKLGDPSVFPEPEEPDTATSFMFEDFEDGTDNWYILHSEHGSGEIEATKAGKGRRGTAAHFTCKNDSLFGWTLMGRYLGDSIDMSALDSVVFWARATLNPDTSKRTYVSFSFDVNVDSTSSGESGKAWVHMDVDTVWTRYVVHFDSLEPVDDKHTGGNLGWYAVRKTITNISIFGGVGGEFWIDDIEFFGMKKFTIKDVEKD